MSNYKDGRGRPLDANPTGPGTALAQFLIERTPELKLTNEEIARALGYARANVVSMWKAGKTKFTWDNLFEAAKLFRISPDYLLALTIDQYVSQPTGVDRFADIVDMIDRMVTPEEMEVVQLMRQARRYNVMPATEEQKKAVLELFKAPAGTSEGYYKPLESAKHVEEGDRRRFARRGFHRDLTIEEAEEERAKVARARAEIEASRKAEREKRTGAAPSPAAEIADTAEKPVRKRSAASKR